MDQATLPIRELDLDMISPRPGAENKNSSKIVVIGKSGSGKTMLIKSLLYNKHRLIPAALVFNGTENVVDKEDRYGNFIPPIFVHNKLDSGVVDNFIKRQTIAKEQLVNPWSVMIIDDCTDDPKIFKTQVFHKIAKYGRHWKMMFILALQYGMDIPRAVRSQMDGTFILRETNLAVRKTLFDNFAGIFPDFKSFCDVMDQITNNFTALYVMTHSTSNDWTQNVFYYKAKPIPDDFKFGNKDAWEFHKQRYNTNFTESFC